jgi:pyrroline-5-carboxylate reductase
LATEPERFLGNTAMTIAFIGAGNMAGSLIRGLKTSGTPAGHIVAADPAQAQLNALANLGIKTTTDNAVAVDTADIVVLAIKPQITGSVLQQLPPLKRHQLVISIVAGIDMRSLQDWLPNEQPIVRCMPNTPALLGAGITGLFANSSVNDAQRQEAQDILNGVGSSVWVAEETQLDAVTAVSGSGPAYYFLLMESMVASARALGLDADTSRKLVVETARGAALMACEPDADPATLRRNVTSPGGTTEAALNVMQEQGLPTTVDNALKAAKDRAEALALEFGSDA